jgi:hypothetical protein
MITNGSDELIVEMHRYITCCTSLFNISTATHILFFFTVSKIMENVANDSVSKIMENVVNNKSNFFLPWPLVSAEKCKAIFTKKKKNVISCSMKIV